MKKLFVRTFSSLFTLVGLIVVVLPAGAASRSTLTTLPLSTKTKSLDSSKVVFQEVASGFAQPLYITNAGDGSGRIFIVERAGYIRILNNGVILPAPFLDIHSIVKSSSSEQGLIALAFHPSYETNGEFFVVYTSPRNGDTNGSNLILERFSVSANPNLADPNSGVVLLTISHPTNSNHNGGTLVFGQDGYLYWSTGDGGGGGDPANNAQNLNSLLGKILRLDVNLAPPYIPNDNPFYNNPSPNIRKEIWAYGLRNPWRFSFDRLTNDMYIGDVGQGDREEINFQPETSSGGENYGWRIMEGSLCYNPSSGCSSAGKVLPVAEYSHSIGCSITGGYVYRGSTFPALQGIYFFADFCTGVVFSLYNDINSGWTKTQIADLPYNISTFGEDEQGNLYLSNYSSGKIYQIQYADTYVASITRADPDPTNAASVDFIVTLSENVTGVDLSDFSLTTSGVSSATVSGVSGSGSSYTVTVNTGNGDGTIRLDLVDDDTIINSFSNPLSGAGVGNGNFDSGEIYTIDHTPPGVLSIVRTDTNPTASAQVSFLVTFSEAVLNVDKGDFTLSTTELTRASVYSVSGSGAMRTIVVNTGTGDGTILLNLVDDDTIMDAASNPLGGVGAGNGDFSGETYTIDKPDLRAPILRSPRSKVVLKNNLPSFWWTSVQGAQSYEIQLAGDNSFTVNVVSVIVNGSPYIVTIPLGDSTFYWRVRAYNASNKSGSWSPFRVLTIDTTAPPIPVLSSPANNSSTRRIPIFKWQKTNTAIAYQFQFDNNSNFTSPSYTVTTRGNFRRPPVMKVGTYYWRVHAKDAAGNWSAWSVPFTITITDP